MTGVEKATLSFYQWTDFEGAPFDWGSIRILNAADDSELAVVVNELDPQLFPAWEEFKIAIPPAGLNQNIKVEFRFFHDDADVGQQAGWYIDNFSITAP